MISLLLIYKRVIVMAGMFDDIEKPEESEEVSIPHSFPYQGGKRKLIPQILPHIPKTVKTIYEPFAGSAAFTLACAANNIGSNYVISDILSPLIKLWDRILSDPNYVTEYYHKLWTEANFIKTRNEFNIDQDPCKFLFLICRSSKNAIRFNLKGEFNHPADPRRTGIHPDKLKKNILATHDLLKNKTTAIHCDYTQILKQATKEDFIFMDPPCMDTIIGPNKAYIQPIDYTAFIKNIKNIIENQIPFAITYDGTNGIKNYGSDLSIHLPLKKIELDARMASNSTIQGNKTKTIENLYIPLYL